MHQTTLRRDFRLGRVARVVRTGASLAGVALAMRWSVGYPLPLLRSLVVGQVTFDQLLVGAVALIAWIVLGWASVVVAIEMATAIPGALGRQFAALAGAVTPATVRRLTQAAIGISVLVGPMTPARAFAADGSGSSPPTAAVLAAPASTTATLAPLDRPVDPGLVTLDLDRPGPPTAPAPAAAVPTPTPSSAALVAGTPQREAMSPTYVVRRGDALWDVAARHLGPGATAADIAREWPRWYAANRAVIGPDPGLIHPGDVLVPPSR